MLQQKLQVWQTKTSGPGPQLLPPSRGRLPPPDGRWPRPSQPLGAFARARSPQRPVQPRHCGAGHASGCPAPPALRWVCMISIALHDQGLTAPPGAASPHVEVVPHLYSRAMRACSPPVLAPEPDCSGPRGWTPGSSPTRSTVVAYRLQRSHVLRGPQKCSGGKPAVLFPSFWPASSTARPLHRVSQTQVRVAGALTALDGAGRHGLPLQRCADRAAY